MEEHIKPYSDLTEEEMLEFMHEIESEDDSLIDAQQDFAAEVALKSEMSEDYDKSLIEIPTEIDEDLLPEEKMTDNAWSYFREWDLDEKSGKYTFKGLGIQLCSDAKEKLSAKMRQLERNLEESRKTRAQQKKEIARLALDQNLFDLPDTIPDYQLQRLIYLLTCQYTYMVNKLETYINNRLTTMMRPLIPRLLRNCMQRYPQSMIEHPGFMYIASKEYGNGLKLWVKPKIPYYFQQYTEMKILRNEKPDLLYPVDKAVEQYFRNRDLRTEQETRYAMRLCNMKTKTYFGLLQLNPFWFKILYDDYKKGMDEYLDKQAQRLAAKKED